MAARACAALNLAVAGYICVHGVHSGPWRRRQLGSAGQTVGLLCREVLLFVNRVPAPSRILLVSLSAAAVAAKRTKKRLGLGARFIRSTW